MRRDYDAAVLLTALGTGAMAVPPKGAMSTASVELQRHNESCQGAGSVLRTHSPPACRAAYLPGLVPTACNKSPSVGPGDQPLNPAMRR